MDSFKFEELHDPHSGSRMLKSDEAADLLGLTTSIFFATSIGSKVPQLSSDKNRKHNSVVTHSSKFCDELPHFLDLDFLEEINNFGASSSRTSVFKKEDRYYNTFERRNLSEYEPKNHNDTFIGAGNEAIEDDNYLWESALFLPEYQPFMKPKQAPETISKIWNGSVVEKERLSRTFPFPRDLDSLSDSVVSDEPIVIDAIASSSDSSPTISNCISDQVHGTEKLTSQLAVTSTAISLVVEDGFSPATESSPSPGAEQDSSVKGVNEDAPSADYLLHESDKDRESQDVAELN